MLAYIIHLVHNHNTTADNRNVTEMERSWINIAHNKLVRGLRVTLCNHLARLSPIAEWVCTSLDLLNLALHTILYVFITSADRAFVNRKPFVVETKNKTFYRSFFSLKGGGHKPPLQLSIVHLTANFCSSPMSFIFPVTSSKSCELQQVWHLSDPVRCEVHGSPVLACYLIRPDMCSRLKAD